MTKVEVLAIEPTEQCQHISQEIPLKIAVRVNDVPSGGIDASFLPLDIQWRFVYIVPAGDPERDQELEELYTPFD